MKPLRLVSIAVPARAFRGHLPRPSAFALLPVTLLLAGVAPRAHAAGQTPPSYGALPQAAETSPPLDHPPSRVAPNEKVDGIVVAYPPKQMLRNGKPTYVMVAVNEALANPFAGKQAEPDGTCFSQTMKMGKDVAPEWMPSGESRLTLMIPTAENHEPAVLPLRSEKLVTQGGKPSLQVTYAWVDPASRGVRLIGRQNVPLAPIATGPSGVTVFSARDTKWVDVVVKSSDVEAASMRPGFGLTRSMMGMGPDGRAVSASCGHTRVRLHVEPQAAEIATFVGDVDLAPVQEQAVQAAGRTVGSTDFRQRSLRISVSSTWLSRDKEPVLSVSFGWAGAEKSQTL
jgi:hypothetical protein